MRSNPKSQDLCGNLYSQYCHSFRNIPLLTAKEEADLSKIMENCSRNFFNLLYQYSNYHSGNHPKEEYLGNNSTGFSRLREALQRRITESGNGNAPPNLVKSHRKVSYLEEMIQILQAEGKKEGYTHQQCKDYIFECIYYQFPWRVLIRAAAEALKQEWRLEKESLQKTYESLRAESQQKKKQETILERKRITNTLILTKKNLKKIDQNLLSLEENLLQEKNYRAQFINSNVRLVISSAKCYMRYGLSFLDVIQYGNLGLVRAIDRFDYRRGLKFSTYAVWWIMQAITRSIAEESRTIRIPVNILREISLRLYRFEQLRNTCDESGKKISDEAAAETIGSTLSEIEEYQKILENPISLDVNYSVRDADSGTLLDSLEDKKVLTGDERVSRPELRFVLNGLLAGLSSKDEYILRSRFGLGAKEKTLEELGAERMCTRENIRLREKAALKKLNTPRKKRRLEPFI